MKFNRNLIAIFAIFLVVFSACAVSAADDAAVSDDDNTSVGEDTTTTGDEDGDGEDNLEDDGEYEAIYDSEDGTNGPGPMDAENSDLNIPLGSEAPDNQTPASASGELSTSSNLNKNAAGNPVMVLLAALAVLGTFSIRRN